MSAPNSWAASISAAVAQGSALVSKSFHGIIVPTKETSMAVAGSPETSAKPRVSEQDQLSKFRPEADCGKFTGKLMKMSSWKGKAKREQVMFNEQFGKGSKRPGDKGCVQQQIADEEERQAEAKKQIEMAMSGV